jgi:acyl-CoA synthetase (AMP-forming)/AMP-acid ligase II
VLSLEEGASLDEAALLAFARTRVAGYKLPRRLVLAPHVQRAPNGKADYPWAKAAALAAETVTLPSD